jgi:hypothetical protein
MGRPSIDPELMVRMLVVGYVFAIRSERLICREVQVNLAYIGRHQGCQPTAIEPRQDINPIQLSLAHQHHTHRIRSLQTSRPRGRRLTFQLCSVLTF